jgi:hypothetical protein
MEREETRLLIESATEDFIDVCPHCGARAHLKKIFSESHKQNNRDVIYFIVFRCVPCKKLILETYRFAQNSYSSEESLSAIGWENKFPSEEIMMTQKFEGIVPEDTLSDYKEGVISLKNKCLKASVNMFRRSLQSALIERGASKGEDLIEQIKNIPMLTSDIKDWAHNIRIFGNWGSHPQDDNLKEIDQSKVEEAQNFLEEFFNYVYVMPSRVAKARGVKGVSANEEGSKKGE